MIKRILFTYIILLTGLSLYGQGAGGFTIDGDLLPVIRSWGVDPDSVSLVFFENHHHADSVPIRDGKFTYTGEIESRYVASAYLRLFGPQQDEGDEAVSMTLPVFLEPGTITVRCRELPDEGIFDIRVNGTPSNDLMTERMSGYYDLNYKMLEIAQDSTLADEEKMPLVYGLYEQQDSLIRYLYRDNRESAIAPMLAIQQFYGTNDFRGAGEALEYLDARFPGHPDLHDLESVWMSMKGIGPGDPLPDVTVEDATGQPVSLANLTDGGYLLIDFWSSLVGPSVEQLPLLDALPDRYEDKPLHVIHISTDNTRTGWLKALKKYKPAGPAYWDPEHQASKAFHLTSYPVRFLVDPEGQVIAKGNFTEIPEIEQQEDPILFF